MKENELTLVDVFSQITENVLLVLLVIILAIPILFYLLLEEFLYSPQNHHWP